MDYKRREEIFAKDYITTSELQELLGFKCASQASQKLMEMKRVVGDKLGVKGKIHTEDYFAFFNIHPTDRYNRLTKDRELSENENKDYNPVCEARKHGYTGDFVDYRSEIERKNEETRRKNYEFYRQITAQSK